VKVLKLRSQASGNRNSDRTRVDAGGASGPVFTHGTIATIVDSRMRGNDVYGSASHARDSNAVGEELSLFIVRDEDDFGSGCGHGALEEDA
jgi:hypothetical protein